MTDLESRLALQGKNPRGSANTEKQNLLRQRKWKLQKKTEGQLRDEIASASATGRHIEVIDKLKAEKRPSDRRTTRHRPRRTGKARRELNLVHQQRAETAWSTERMENALLRGTEINDIAAEVQACGDARTQFGRLRPIRTRAVSRFQNPTSRPSAPSSKERPQVMRA